ncbi:MAG: DEAD/DEAH box helicase family protein [Chloroflexota bacterium]
MAEPSTPGRGAPTPPAPATVTAPPTDGFARTAFPLPLRRYQELALDAFEAARAAGDRRHYLTLPPGAGKTLLGLEIARRLGRPTLVLAPNTAIVGQWLDQWSRFEPAAVPISDERDLATPITALTYQALCVLERDDGDDEDDDEGEGDTDAGGTPEPGAPSAAAHADELTPAQRRRLVARGGDRDAVLGLLHAHGRAIVDRLAAMGPVTLVLDESHHLLELWGSLLVAVVESLHPDTAVVALTATPPVDLGPREQGIHDTLFGRSADVEVVAPAVVKDGYLAPYQELALLTEPLADEARFIGEQAGAFAALLAAVQGPDLASLPFLAWLDRRTGVRRAEGGAQVAWSTLATDDPDLALAVLRFRWHRDEPPPPGARFAEIHRREPDSADWAALLDRWAMEALAPSKDPRDREAWERLRAGLPAAGYRLTARGVVRGASAVDRVLALSASKALAAATILSTEAAMLGDRLRGLVLCDHESASRDPGARLRGVLDPGAGSATLVLRTLLDGTAVEGLDPVLVTGRSVACGRGTAEALVRFAAGLVAAAAASGAADDPATAPRTGSAAARLLDGARALAAWDPLDAATPSAPVRPASASGHGDAAAWDDLVLVDPPDPRWSSRTWVPLITRFFTDGGSRCLIGTRALLGEGWDAPAVNVVIDLTTATTRAAVHQMRGRGMRLDPADRSKVADLWDIACVADGHPQGAVDHARLARKHLHDLAVNAEGDVESGVAHLDPVLSPYAPPDAAGRAALRTRMLARPAARDAARAAWRIGEPYRDVPVATVRVRTRWSPGTPLRDPLRHHPAVAGRGADPLRRAALLAGGLAILLMLVAGWMAGPTGALAGLGLGAVIGGLWVLLLLVGGLRTLGTSDTLLDLGRAVADALASTGLTGHGTDARAVRVVAQPDGWYRCLLDGASEADSERFATALDELMAPLWDPRWLISRPVLEVQPTLVGAAKYARQRLSGRFASAPQVWHTVPDVLATRQDHVAAFQAAWRRWVAPGATTIKARDPQGEAILAARRGDDPFRTETQLRTLWT